MVPLTTMIRILINCMDFVSNPTAFLERESWRHHLRHLHTHNFPSSSVTIGSSTFSGVNCREKKMHIWPSIKLRDSFKVAYLDNLERNLQRMKKSEKKNPQSQALINKGVNGGDGEDQSQLKNPNWFWPKVICRDVLWILTCCFCLGVCGDDYDII